MNSYDPEVARRVWQRVQRPMESVPAPALPQPTLTDCMVQKQQDAAVYLHLSRRLQGKDSAAMQRLHEQELSQLHCLKGLHTLKAGSCPGLPGATPRQEPVEVILRRCCSREMQNKKRYEALSGDPEFGQIYGEFARQELEHCQVLLEILGRLEAKKHPGQK